MAYDWYDATGWLAPGPSTGGWAEARPWLRRAGRETARLVRRGATDAPRLVAAELAQATPPPPGTPARDVWDALRAVALRSRDGVLILSDGVGVDVEVV